MSIREQAMRGGDVITDADLIEASANTFGDDRYGHLALDILERERRLSFVRLSRQNYSYDEEGKKIPVPIIKANSRDDIRGVILAGRSASSATAAGVEAAAIEAVREAEAPFNYTFFPKLLGIDDDINTVGFLVPTSLSRPGLATLASRIDASRRRFSSNDPDNLRLRGAIARAHDTLLVAGGIGHDVDPDASDISSELVDYKVLLRDIEAMTTRGTRDYFDDHVRINIGWLAERGRAFSQNYAGLAVEGIVRLGNLPIPVRDGVILDYIARSSLRNIHTQARHGKLKAALEKI